MVLLARFLFSSAIAFVTAAIVVHVIEYYEFSMHQEYSIVQVVIAAPTNALGMPSESIDYMLYALLFAPCIYCTFRDQISINQNEQSVFKFVLISACVPLSLAWFFLSFYLLGLAISAFENNIAVAIFQIVSGIGGFAGGLVVIAKVFGFNKEK